MSLNPNASCENLISTKKLTSIPTKVENPMVLAAENDSNFNVTTKLPNQAQSMQQHDLKYILKYSFGGGLTGSAAMGCQVTLLMWMRTVMNYQYRFAEAGNFFHAVKRLYTEGGILRLYRGYPQAMLQAPLSRFGDAAANELALQLSQQNSYLKKLPVTIQTGLASTVAAFWRLNLMPIDAWKTIKQVEGSKGTSILFNKVRTNGISVLYHGMGATFAATLAGHYPWFATYNYLSHKLPRPLKPPTVATATIINNEVKSNVLASDETLKSSPLPAPSNHYNPPNLTTNLRLNYEICNLGRQALIGFVASVVSDTVTNSLRVIKTVKQTSGSALTYMGVIEKIRKDNEFNRRVYAEKHHKNPPKILLFGDGSVFTRGLGTRIAVNGLQGLTFSVLWKIFMDHYSAVFLKHGKD